MTAPHINDTPDPKIGGRYLVPCLLYRGLTKHDTLRDMRGYIPIIGPLHEDAEIIGFEPQHWHIDWRFAPNRAFAFRGCHEKWRLLGMPICDRNFHGQPTQHAVPVERDAAGNALIFDRPNKMLRAMPIIPPGKAGWAKKLEAAFAGARLKCNICPHKGLNLTSLPAVNGVVTCPGHGLHWRKDTGELVKTI